MSNVAIIGGSGLDSVAELEDVERLDPTTPYGPTSAPVIRGRLAGTDVHFLARHGTAHTIPPHAVNYRANIHALAALGVERVFAVTAVGGIALTASPGRIVIPDQIIDYTWGREHTFYDGVGNAVQHIDFTYPFGESLRRALIDAAAAIGLPIEPHGVYGATQGPRLETAAEIRRMARDGCTVVGMTAMPEAGLAREAGLDYANCSLVVNWAAGTHDQPVSMDDIATRLDAGMGDVVALLGECIAR